jgi:orotidine-5'-phosphate decarboxylase
MSFEDNDTSKIIVALDYNKESDALLMAEKLDPSLCILKVGLELFVSNGPNIINKLHALDYKIFLDLKFHDINNTVVKSSVSAAELGVWMINIHSSGGKTMMTKVSEEIKKNNHNTLVLGVTILTSLDDDEIKEIGYSKKMEEQVLNMAELCYESNLNGVVCSAREVSIIKNKFSDNFICVCPGIRSENNKKDDQKRFVTPSIASNNGADYIVVGRPITSSKDPLESLIKIKKEFDNPL